MKNSSKSAIIKQNLLKSNQIYWILCITASRNHNLISGGSHRGALGVRGARRPRSGGAGAQPPLNGGLHQDTFWQYISRLHSLPKKKTETYYSFSLLNWIFNTNCIIMSIYIHISHIGYSSSLLNWIFNTSCKIMSIYIHISYIGYLSSLLNWIFNSNCIIKPIFTHTSHIGKTQYQ